MDWLPKFIGIMVFLAVIGVAVGIARRVLPLPGRASRHKLPYCKKDWLFSKAEHSFFSVLRGAIGDNLLIFAKVRLLDLVWLPTGTQDRQSWRNRVQSKHVDFVLCSRDTVAPVLVIELDDASHERNDRQSRDDFVNRVLRDAGLPILRVPVRQSYNQRELAVQLRQLLSPVGTNSVIARPA